jgi:hypothetical protein
MPRSAIAHSSTQLPLLATRSRERLDREIETPGLTVACLGYDEGVELGDSPSSTSQIDW